MKRPRLPCNRAECKQKYYFQYIQDKNRNNSGKFESKMNAGAIMPDKRSTEGPVYIINKIYGERSHYERPVNIQISKEPLAGKNSNKDYCSGENEKSQFVSECS